MSWWRKPQRVEAVRGRDFGVWIIAAVRHGRNYVGLDISDEYLKEQSRARIDNIQHVMAGL